MLYLKYKLYNGVQPQDAIKVAVPTITNSDMFMGQWPSGDWIYGEINTDSQNQPTLETALINWSGTFLTDLEAIAWIDTILPVGTIIRSKKVAGSTIINSTTAIGHAEKQIIES